MIPNPFEAHAAVTHFPVALLLTALVFEAAARRTRRESLGAAARWTLAAGVLMCVPALASGWWLAAPAVSSPGGAPKAVLDHRTAACVASALSALALLARRAKPGPLRSAGLALQAAGAVAVGVTGFLGGQMVMARQAPPSAAATMGRPAPLDLKLALEGQRLFRSPDVGCTSCHGVGRTVSAPDLQGVGLRRPDADWHIRHLREPSVVNPGSTMPSFSHLGEGDLRALAEYLRSQR